MQIRSPIQWDVRESESIFIVGKKCKFDETQTYPIEEEVSEVIYYSGVLEFVLAECSAREWL